MNLQTFIENIVDTLGFSDGEKKEISSDLINAIGVKYVIDISKQNQDVSKIEKAIESKNQSEIVSALDNSVKIPDNNQLFEKITQDIIYDWLNSVLPKVEDEKLHKAIALLKSNTSVSLS